MTATRSGASSALERLLDLLGERPDVDLGAPARGAGHDVESALTQVQRLEDRDAGLDLLDRVGRERHADRVADALREQRTDADRGLDRAGLQRPRLGDTEVQRVVAGSASRR
jgi:hypothetical protein